MFKFEAQDKPGEFYCDIDNELIAEAFLKQTEQFSRTPIKKADPDSEDGGWRLRGRRAVKPPPINDGKVGGADPETRTPAVIPLGRNKNAMNALLDKIAARDTEKLKKQMGVEETVKPKGKPVDPLEAEILPQSRPASSKLDEKKLITPDQIALPIGTMQTSDAEAHIQGCTEPKALRQMLDNESKRKPPRPPLVEAIKAKLKAMGE